MTSDTRYLGLALGRRAVLVGGAGVLFGRAAIVPAQADGPTADYAMVRAKILGGRAVRMERVTLDIPRIAESGNSVPLHVTVASPMTDADHVTTIHILSELNPYALIARFHLGPRAGIAAVRTNIRLATTQVVHAIAETSDGAVYEGQTETVVALAACLDGS